MGNDEAVARRERINAASVNGAWTRETLQSWGVPWPPPPGWRTHLILHGIPYQTNPVDADDKPSHDPGSATNAER